MRIHTLCYMIMSLLIFCLLVNHPQQQARAAETVSYQHQIRKILSAKCFHCHGPDEEHREADLRLDQEESAKRSAIVAHQPENSSLMERVASEDDDLRMPPPDSGKSLSKEEVELLRQWISEGAIYEKHWAFLPISSPEVPATKKVVSTEIDRFVISKLEQKGLSLTPAVNRQQLIRRVTFDLIGLPPTWEEVEAFVKNDSPDAYEQLIDRLLASERYGERWGRHWLDLARYADTHGGSAIGYTRFPFSYTYRDYVIHAFNNDVPYNQFIREQLAADQLELKEHDPTLAALGFLTVGMQFRNPHDVIDDQIDVVTRGLLGLTVACARCHDHKYDPISSRDYYSLYAIFASSEAPELLPIVGEQPHTSAGQNFQQELNRRQTIYQNMARDQTEVMRNRLRMQVGLYLTELAKGTPEQDLSSAFLSYRTDDLRPLVLNRWREYVKTLPKTEPVFGPWVQLSKFPTENFEAQCQELVKQWKQETGDPKQFENPQNLSTPAPKWNPRLLNELEENKPASMLELADVYGKLFAEVQREWLVSLLEASLEAQPGATIVTDQAPNHQVINSVVHSQIRKHLHGEETPTNIPDKLATTLLNRTVRDQLNGKKGSVDQLLLNSPDSPPRAMILQEDSQPETYHVFRRGNPIDRGEQVQPRFLSLPGSGDAELKTFPAGKQRLSLAKEMTDPDNPLLRRVVANWVWQHHFGKGLVRSPDNFGLQGEPPTHPGLLDYLATVLLEENWSLKRLHKRIMLSDAYRQGAVENHHARKLDPENRLLWRMPRLRLDMEAMRDAMLAVSGELDLNRIGGRPFDFQTQPIVPRRSLYGFVNRDFVSSLESTFDRANPNTCTASRPHTTVPQQALFALNSSFIQDRAQTLANATQGISSPEERIRTIYRKVLSRTPDEQQLELAMQFVTREGDNTEQQAKRWSMLTHALLASNEFMFLD